jgi:hypothetical protein
MRFARYSALDNANASVNQQSAIIDASQVYAISAQIVVTGTAAGTVNIQYSNDFVGNMAVPQPVNFSVVPSTTLAVSGAGVYSIPRVELCYRWLKIVYVASSGTGTITVNSNTLGI